MQFLPLGFLDQGLHLPGEGSNSTGGGNDSFLFFGRFTRSGELTRQIIWFHVEKTGPVDDS